MRKILLGSLFAITAATIAPSSAIVGGRSANDGEFPWTAAIFTGSSPAGTQFCGGTLVASDVVVTAAHCVTELVNNLAATFPLDPFRTRDPAGIRLKIMVGSRSLSGAGSEQRYVSKVTTHPDPDIDVAVLELESSVATEPIPVIAAGADSSLDATGVVATIVGWGATSEGGNGSTVLKAAEVPIVSDSTCRASYGSSMNPAKEICAGYPQGGTDTCQGDSGGPMVVKKPNGAWILAGATSWGDGCARPHKYGVYAEMRAAAAFINSF